MTALVVEEWPTGLRRPMLVVAFAGWNDAAESATSAARYLRAAFAARRFAAIDPEEFYQFGLNRPQIRFREGSRSEREIVWPANEFFCSHEATLPRDVLIGIGVEPHLKWQTYCRLILDIARRCQVALVLTLGALLADVPHTRPVPVTGTATDQEFAALLRIAPTRYEGPTGIVGVLNQACRQAGFSVASLWANVPHYISTVTNPRATLVLVQRTLGFLGWATDLSELEEAAAQFDVHLSEIVAQNPKVARYIKELEGRQAEGEEGPGERVEELPSAQELIKELEQFLRQPRRDPGQG